jgi:hypothetical protein
MPLRWEPESEEGFVDVGGCSCGVHCIDAFEAILEEPTNHIPCSVIIVHIRWYGRCLRRWGRL